jgi:hypothetical protein
MFAESVMQLHPRPGVVGSVWGSPEARRPIRVVVRSPGRPPRFLRRRLGVPNHKPDGRNAPVRVRRLAPPTQPLRSRFNGPHAGVSAAGPIGGLTGLAGAFSSSNEEHRRAMTWAAMARGDIRIGNVVGYGDGGTKFKIQLRRVQGRMASAASHHQMVAPEISATRPRRITSARMSGTCSRDSGTPSFRVTTLAENLARCCALTVLHASVTRRRKFWKSKAFRRLKAPKCMIGDLGVVAEGALAEPVGLAADSA